MRTEENIFGSGMLYEAKDISGKIYCACTACMSIYSEFLSWANFVGGDRFTLYQDKADSIIVLSCQVTDLAVLNDIVTLEDLMKKNKSADFYIGGCLARRFDIELPTGVKRLDNISEDGHIIYSRWMVDYKHPFWVKEFDESDGELKDGHIFRNMYPLRIGVGCAGKCKYCTIRYTRGEHKKLEPNIREFEFDEDVVLIADSPSVEQLKRWIIISERYNKPISIRNVEPSVTVKIYDQLLRHAEKGLLKIFHCPIQHTDLNAIIDMRRSYSESFYSSCIASELRKRGTICATNIIIDYKSFPNPDMEKLKSIYDYISWNPYWNGVWDRKIAEERFEKYINNER